MSERIPTDVLVERARGYHHLGWNEGNLPLDALSCLWALADRLAELAAQNERMRGALGEVVHCMSDGCDICRERAEEALAEAVRG